MSDRHYPPEADIIIASKDGSSRYDVEHPDIEGKMNTPAMDEEMACKMASDEHPETEWTEWGVVE